MQSSSAKFFENLMSEKKEIREQAEKELEQLKQMPVSQSIPVFTEGMSSQVENIFQLSTLIFKKVFCDNQDNLSKLSPTDKESLINLVKSKIDFNGSKTWKSLQRIAEALAPLYNASNLSVGFNDIINWFKDQGNALSRKFAIYLIEMLSNISAITEEKLDEGAINNFQEIFTRGLDDPDIDVKVGTLSSATQFLANIKKEETLLKFNGLTDKMLSALIATLKYENENSKNESKGKAALETMNEIVEQFPSFWKGKTEDIINIVNEISKGKIFANNIRECALELVYTLAKNSPSVIKKSDGFKKLFLPLLFNLMLEVDCENDLNSWEKKVEEDETDAEEMFYGVRDSFERLSLDLGGDFFMGVTSDYIKKYLNSQNWIEVHAAFNALAYMAEGCNKSFRKNIKELLQFISTGLTNTHPRVRYAALFAFGLILKSTAPKPQKEFTNNILPALAQLMGEKETSLRVKTQSCNALVEFLRGLLNDELSSDESQKLIANYTNDLIKLTSQLFEYSLSVSYSPLQEASLSAISILSNLLEKNFAPYYDQLMPGLKKLFYGLNAQTAEQKKLKSNTIETMGFLCSSIAEESQKYMKDLNEISDAFLQYMANLKEEDPQLSTIIHSFTHLSLAMKENFVPILDKLLPTLENYIKADIGFKMEDAALTEYIPEDKDEKNIVGSVEVNLGSNTTKLSLHTFALQNKILGFTVLNEIALNMGQSFYKYIEKLLNLSKELLEFPFNRKIRKTAVKNLEAALNSCPTDADKKKVIDFFGDHILKSFTHAIEKKFMKDIKCNLKAMTLAFNLITDKTNFSEKFIGSLYDLLGKTCQLIDSLKIEIINSVADKKIEEDEEDEVMDEFNELNEIERKVMEVSGILFKLFGEPLTALIAKNLYDSFLNNWNSNLKRNQLKSDQEVLSSICFFDDLIEYGDNAVVGMFVPIFIDNTFDFKTENEDILQSAVFGYGVIAKKLNREDFKQYNQKVIGYIAKVMQREVNEDNGRTYDNAVSSMGKYIIYQCNADNNSLTMGKQFIKLLPLKNDIDEGKVICEEFFTQLKNNNPILVNEGNMGEIKQTLADIKALNDEKKFLEDQEKNLNELLGKF